ncbi:hypothetical protein JTE90_022440 [Oedothorax gibbosus]|uniref:HTH myb-type domain-containing protein n=1 Tax=Oedothorax gibbosus TaxID=931172 RepID=A0AAV6TRN9_9ARAC|nr:hypothetical protein JTE90_022440 [Oedothorax gibbosus]
MEHDIRIHREYYRLPDNILQTAKLSKLFLALEKGNLPKLSGKSLDDIQVSIDEDIKEGDLTDDDSEEESAAATVTVIGKKMLPLSVEQRCSNQKKTGKRIWSDAEKEAVDKHLGAFILRGKLPDAIRNCISAEVDALGDCDWKM